MVQVKHKGFISNIYVFYNLITAVFFTSLFAVLIWSNREGFPYLLFLCMLPFIFFAVQVIYYIRAPIAYGKYEINAEGVRCREKFIKYEEISRITICESYVAEWFGFRFVETFLGVSQHEKVSIEDMICLNCEFMGYKSKKAKSCIYIPKNKKTDALLKKYCIVYTDLLNANPEKCNRELSMYDGRNTVCIVYTAIMSSIIFIACVLLVSNGIISILRAVLVATTGTLSITSILCKRIITSWLRCKL